MGRADSHLAVPTDEPPATRFFATPNPTRLVRGLGRRHDRARRLPGLPDEPATYVPELLQDVLRGKLRFRRSRLLGRPLDGRLDHGPLGGSTPAERAVSALAAGCDMVLHCNHGDELDGLLDGVAARWTPTDAFAARLARLMPEEAGRPAPDADPVGVRPARFCNSWEKPA